jgi:trimeric autotransporter adhesin
MPFGIYPEMRKRGPPMTHDPSAPWQPVPSEPSGGMTAPIVTGINPARGAAGGGDTVTVTGTGFTGARSVLFGSVAGTNLTVVSDTQLTVTSPPPNASGTVDVTVTTPAGTSATSAADQFTYAAAAAAATVTGINPARGAAGGGDTVTVTGTGFTGARSVLFGSVAGTNLTVVSDTQLTVTSPPPNASGTVDVTVTTPAGTSATSAADQFTYGAGAVKGQPRVG